MLLCFACTGYCLAISLCFSRIRSICAIPPTDEQQAVFDINTVPRCRRFLSNLTVPDDLAAIAVTGLPRARMRSAVEINLQRIKRARPTKQSDAARAGRKLHFLTSGEQINGLVYHRPDLSTAISTSTRVATQCKRFVRLSAPALRELPASSWLPPPRCCAERISWCVSFVERKTFVNYTGCSMRSITRNADLSKDIR